MVMVVAMPWNGYWRQVGYPARIVAGPDKARDRGKTKAMDDDARCAEQARRGEFHGKLVVW